MFLISFLWTSFEPIVVIEVTLYRKFTIELAGRLTVFKDFKRGFIEKEGLINILNYKKILSFRRIFAIRKKLPNIRLLRQQHRDRHQLLSVKHLPDHIFL